MVNKKVTTFFILIILGSQFAAVVFQISSWPLTTFPMYAWPRPLDGGIRDHQILASLKDGTTVQVLTPRGKVSWGVYPHLIDSGTWDIVRDQAIEYFKKQFTSDVRLKDTVKIMVVLTSGRIDEKNELKLSYQVLLNIDPETYEYNVP